MQHVDQIERYVEGVRSGEIVAGRLQKLAVRRHLWDLETQEERGLEWVPKKANAACEFFPGVLRHSKGEWAGKPFELSDTQAFIIGSVWGWRKKDTGLRRFTRAYCEVARKYGKSETGAGVALLMGTYDDPLEPGAWVNLCATKEDQVKDTTFGQAVKMVNSSPFLRSRMDVRKKRLLVKDSDPHQPGSVITPIGSDSSTSDGFDTSGAILDELHAWRRHHHEHYEKMTTAGGSRRQELVWFWTTAGDDKSELWAQLREQMVRVLESVETKQVVADHVFAFVACVDEGDDPLSLDLDDEEEFAKFERMIKKANPNYPVTPKPGYIRDRALEAKDNALEANKFMRYHANVQVSSSLRPFPAAKWVELSEEYKGAPSESFGGFDLGRSDDFAAWGVVWEDDDRVRLATRSYTCADRPKHLQTPQIAQWIRQGLLIEHPGDQVDFLAIEDDIAEAHQKYSVRKWAFDETFAKVTAHQLSARLGDGLFEKWIQHQRHYNEPCRRFLKAFNAGNVRPPEDPCLQWQARNVAYVANARDEVMPDKGIGKEYKIDAMVALLMAYGLLIMEPEEQASVYEERGLLVF